MNIDPVCNCRFSPEIIIGCPVHSPLRGGSRANDYSGFEINAVREELHSLEKSFVAVAQERDSLKKERDALLERASVNAMDKRISELEMTVAKQQCEIAILRQKTACIDGRQGGK